MNNVNSEDFGGSKTQSAPVSATTAGADQSARPTDAHADDFALKEMEARKDAAYLERNQVVAALAKCFPSGVAKTAIEGWSEDWHGCVYIDLPTGQVSWHFHNSQAHLFADLPPYTGTWDGHDTPEKYRRVAALTYQPVAVGAGSPATLLQAAGAMRMVRRHDGIGEPFRAYDMTIADHVVAELRAKIHELEDAGRIEKLRTALREISEVRFGWDGDCGVTRIADDALYADDQTCAAHIGVGGENA